MRNAEYLFELSWEVANMVGGIHTVISSKVPKMQEYYGDRYILIGPDISHVNEGAAQFREELWQPEIADALAAAGIECRMGRWLVPGEPKTLLVNFGKLHQERDRILAGYWETYKLDSLHGGWDYLEPLFFGHAAGQAVEQLFKKYMQPRGERIVVHCHEWMSAGAILYLRKLVPQIGTVFTTHATNLGRALAANDRSSDRPLEHLAQEFGVTAKHSLETIAAKSADCFTVTSPALAAEVSNILGREPDLMLYSGFEIADGQQIKKVRPRFFELASLMTGSKYADDTQVLLSAGRYEFHNKGIDLLLDTLGQLNEHYENAGEKNPKLITYLMFPAGHSGPRRELLGTGKKAPGQTLLCTHDLRDEAHDPILQKLKSLRLVNRPDQPVHVIFIPIYLDGQDPLLTEKYYDLLAAADLTCFPSHYEPWGYTPLESIAFGVPTTTTDRSGFGSWAATRGDFASTGVRVISRKNVSYEQSVRELFTHLVSTLERPEKDLQQLRKAATLLSAEAHWNNWGKAYFQAEGMAMKKADERVNVDTHPDRMQPNAGLPASAQAPTNSTANLRRFTVLNKIPKQLEKLRQLSKNIWWDWNPEGLELFSKLDPATWVKSGFNPTVFLDSVKPQALESAAKSKNYLDKLRSVFMEFERAQSSAKHSPVIAFFCAEYGLSACLKFYSGGLGILAGDLVKTASDMKLPLCAVGLAYHYGYFRQRINHDGYQENHYEKNNFHGLPMQLVTGENGEAVTVPVSMPSGPVYVRGWKIAVGDVNVYLLDTDFAANRPADRAITNSLYSGDRTHRLRQEYILGIGGQRFLRAIGADPLVYHMNEGHSAFLVLARLVDLMRNDNLKYDEALEYIRHTSIFTTHTPVAAGHDYFYEDIIRPYLAPFEEALHQDWNTLFKLGLPPYGQDRREFSMTYLSLQGSLRVNGVSEIHGDVSRQMFTEVYPGFNQKEIPVTSITNGVHVPTWLAPEWQHIFSKHLGNDWREHLHDKSFWDGVRKLDSKLVWRTHLDAKARLLNFTKETIQETFKARQEDPTLLSQALANLDEDPLIIGFSRRFAPYKRALLLFQKKGMLEALLARNKPVVFLFAGKAHPQDGVGQALIKQVVEISRQPGFAGKILFLENYDIHMAQLLVAGCDIWLNTPTRPLEASGTSGMKAGINGCLNFSVPDGWWAEGYNGKNGWVIGPKSVAGHDAPIEFQNEADGAQILSTLEHEIIPTFYRRNKMGVPEAWVKMMKESIATLIPGFSSERMVDDYNRIFYQSAIANAKSLSKDNFAELYTLCERKQRLRQNWEQISYSDIQTGDLRKRQVFINQPIQVRVDLNHPNISTDEIIVQAVIARSEPENSHFTDYQAHSMTPASGPNKTGTSSWTAEVSCQEAGPFAFGIRVMPRRYHPDHDLETFHNLVKWF